MINAVKSGGPTRTDSRARYITQDDGTLLETIRIRVYFMKDLRIGERVFLFHYQTST